MISFHDRTVFITGATSGFGRAAARRFAAAGAAIVACGRRADRLEALVAELAPIPVHPLKLDVRDREAVFAAVDALPERFAKVDVLVNNAGLALGLDPAHRASLEDWEQMIDTNCKGLMYCTRALLPGMVERDRGHVINLGSIAGSYAYPGANVYGATKAFVEQFSLNLRADLFGTRVRVTNIEPGLCETEFSMVRFKGDAERADKLYADTTPLTADDIAESIFWAASLPEHVNINRMEIMPVVQSFAAARVHKTA